MPQIRINAPAKLNLHLNVGGLRSDGFHDINSLFLALDFCDTLDICAAEGTAKGAAVEIIMNPQFPAGNNFPDIPLEDNIISRAVSMFRDRTGFDKRLKITVEKRIPAGGGLGGGSSNAAATLLALNRLAFPQTGGLDTETLLEMGAALGSDVPFFLSIGGNAKGNASGAACGAALVGGRGEFVRPFPLPDAVRNLSFLLVTPGFSSDTASAYRLLDNYRQNGKCLTRKNFNTEDTENTEGCLRKIQREAVSAGDEKEEGRPQPFIPSSVNSASSVFFTFPCEKKFEKILALPPCEWPFFNDFLPVFEEGAAVGSPGAVYREIISGLKELGAGFAGLSGSGSACFGVFSSPAEARKAKTALFKRFPYIYETFPLAYQSIQYYNRK